VCASHATDGNALTAPARASLVGLVLTLLAACNDAAEAPQPPEIRPVRVVSVEKQTAGETVSLTGTVQAQTEVNLAFRIDGRMIERAVNVGDHVTAGQVVARLDPQNEENALRSARAEVSGAEGKLVESRNNYERQRELLARGFTTRVRYDEVTRIHRSAQSQLDSARARLNVAEDRLSYTGLVADAAGTVTARGAEPGEVVQAGRMIVQIARQDGRDAVFDVPPQIKDMAPPDPRIEVFLTMDSAVKTVGRIREIAPRADPVTGTFQVRVGLSDPPGAMRLGSTVTGRMLVDATPSYELPASALTRVDRQPAVWIVDPASKTVSLRNIEVLRFDPTRVVVAAGIDSGDIVVTAGVQALRPGQKVRLLGVGNDRSESF
jgi:RND family efflux transporter MFP subunit